MEVEILAPRDGKKIVTVPGVKPTSPVNQLKKEICKLKPSYKYDRLQLRRDAKGKGMGEDELLVAIGTPPEKVPAVLRLYLKDLGPQIGWKTVFLAEYLGPLLVYLLFYSRPWIIYGDDAGLPMQKVARVAALCWCGHYSKRLLETIFVHRFSHATMPLRNLFKNCSYYWGFAAYVAYHVNHPLFTPPVIERQSHLAMLAFIIFEIGNLSTHVLLRNLRPPGTRQRRVPYPNSNPFTFLFNFVSCPNYTYEVLSWVAFTIMTNCLPAAMFAFAGFVQMAIWARGKHKAYVKEFNTYPRDRAAIVPFIY